MSRKLMQTQITPKEWAYLAQIGRRMLATRAERKRLLEALCRSRARDSLSDPPDA